MEALGCPAWSANTTALLRTEAFCTLLGEQHQTLKITCRATQEIVGWGFLANSLNFKCMFLLIYSMPQHGKPDPCGPWITAWTWRKVCGPFTQNSSLLHSLTGVQVALVWSLSSLWGLSTVMSQYLEKVPWMAEWQSGTPGYETGDPLVPGENSQAKKTWGC